MAGTNDSTQDKTGLDRIRQWRRDYRSQLNPSPLEDVSQLVAQLDLTHAHPSGIAQLFASGQVALEALFRDTGMLRAAGRRLERVLEDQASKSRISGVAELSLVVGVATWKGNSVPVLLYPSEVNRHKGAKETDASIRFTGHVRLNPSFVSAMAEQGVDLDERDLFDGSHYENGTPETSAVFAAIATQAVVAFPDFDIERDIILGCFMDPSSQMLLESQRIIDLLQQGPSGNQLLDALAGDEQAISALRETSLPAYSPFDVDPHTETQIGDVDNSVRYAANMAASGRSIFVDSSAGDDTAVQAASIAAGCLSAGRSVLYVPCVAEQKRRFRKTVKASGMEDLMLDLADEQANKNLDRRLIRAVAFQPGAAASHFNQLADELVGVRSRLTRYLADLHGVNEEWGVSAFQTIQNLATIAALPTHPATHVRMSRTTARSLNGHMEDWTAKLVEAGKLGEFTIGPDDAAWYKASLYSEEDAVSAYQRVVNLLQKELPATREQVASTVQTCGFPIPTTAQEWGRQVTVLKNLRRVLDVFQPEIFERDIDAMIEASKPKAERKAEGSSMGFWERRRHIKEAKGLLRVGTQVESLHEALKVVAKQAEQWRVFVPHGGWPVLPAKLDAIIETQDRLSRDMMALDTVLATTAQGGNLETHDFNEVETRLKALFEDRLALDTLPGRCQLEREFQRIGLNELVDDLHTRQVGVDDLEGELLLSWWTTVFEDIVKSSAIISNQDGSALQSASERFAQVDVEHVSSIGPMVAQESMKRLCDLLFSRTQEANQLHTALAGSNQAVSMGSIWREHGEILAAAKPIMLGTPSALASLSDPGYMADVAIIDAGAHMPAIQLLSIVSRARQVVVLAHRNTVTSDSLKALIDLLPSISVHEKAARRSQQLASFLEEEGYGELSFGTATESLQGLVRFHPVEATGVPVIETGLVESSQQEIDQVIRLIEQRAASFTIVPADYTLSVVTLTSVFRSRLGIELKSLAYKNKTIGRFLRHVRLVGINEVAGAKAEDVILSLCYAKTAHGRLLQQFGALEGDGGKGKLLDALALANHNLDIVSAFKAEDLEDDRLHQPGPKLLKTMLAWAQQLDEHPSRPLAQTTSENVLFNDLANRIRARGLNVAVDYGYDGGMKIPLVVGLTGKPFALAVLTDDAQFMSIQSTRRRHRLLFQDLRDLGWSVMTVWSVGAFVNPDKEVDRLVERIGEIYREVQ
ncbi:helicase [Bifidobacterium aemilianum]|uniref:Helicase n=1 Tax=Bifidobacterium aemilianum TaxID=2493120 RepID=A0A366K781_9BIFI|nr:helicase [Bifidobacterium aemilianum]RBP97595.1 helicase [Bifidobacterium aemilianum]